MKLEAALQYLGWDKLPTPGEPTPRTKCVCLVERVTGLKDYAISREKDICADLGYTSSVKRIIEFYPEKKSKKETDRIASEERATAELKAKEEAEKAAEISRLEAEAKAKDEAEKLAAFEKAEKERLQAEYQIALEADLKAEEEARHQEIPVSEPEQEEPEDEEEIPTTSTPPSREAMISFLVMHRNKRETLELKSDEQLSEMAKRFGFKS